MQVFTWRDNGSELVRVPKRPGTPWTDAELGGLTRNRAGAEAIFDALVLPARERDAFRPFRVGALSDLSPVMGVYREGQAELSRVSMGERVHVTCVRGFWAQIHILWRTNSADNARTFAKALVERGRTARHGPNPGLELRLTGQGQLRSPPFVVYLLTGHNVLTGLHAVKLHRSIPRPGAFQGSPEPGSDESPAEEAERLLAEIEDELDDGGE